jgi:hypothetical protein
MIHAARSADDADAQEVLLAAVLARSSRLAPVAEIVQTLRDRLPELGAIEIPDPEEPTEGEQAVYMFEVEGNRAIVAGMPRGYPWSDLEGPCQTAWWWPDAEEALRDHSHHFLCVLMGDAGSILQRHAVLTHLVASVAQHSAATGVYWGGGRMVHEAAAFCTAAEGLNASTLAPFLWIDFRVMLNEDRTCDLATTGLAAFGLMELECERCPWPASELYEFSLDLSNYILTRGESIADAETVGRTGEERIPVHHRPSRWSRPEVQRLEFP